jgi:hypothetical protein
MAIEAACDYLEVTVKPTIQEFLSDTSDVRKGRLAAIVLYHVWDYLELSGDKTRPEKTLTAKNEKLMAETIRAAANASKHFQLTKFNPIASSAAQVMAERNEGLFCAPFGEAVFAESNDVHLILDEDKKTEYGCVAVRLATAVKFMQDYWEQRLGDPS